MLQECVPSSPPSETRLATASERAVFVTPWTHRCWRNPCLRRSSLSAISIHNHHRRHYQQQIILLLTNTMPHCLTVAAGSGSLRHPFWSPVFASESTKHAILRSNSPKFCNALDSPTFGSRHGFHFEIVSTFTLHSGDFLQRLQLSIFVQPQNFSRVIQLGQAPASEFIVTVAAIFTQPPASTHWILIHLLTEILQWV